MGYSQLPLLPASLTPDVVVTVSDLSMGQIELVF